MKKNTRINETSLIIKLLIGLFVFCLLLVGIHYIQNQNTKKALTTDLPTSSPTPTSKSTVAPLPSSTAIIPVAEHEDFAPIPVDNETGFSTGWSTVSTDGSLSASNTFDTDTLYIDGVGNSIDSIFLYRDGIPLIQGTTYTITTNVTSSIDRNFSISIINGDNGNVYDMQTFPASSVVSTVTMNFTMNDNSIYNGSLHISVGNDQSNNSQSSHEMSFNQTRILSSGANYAISTNQVGYQSSDEKRCTFSYDAGDFFDVVNTKDESVVYTGALINRSYNDTTNENNSYGDFTNVTTEGTYYIRSQIGVVSHPFQIGDDVYKDLSDSLLKVLSLQRCGENLDSSWAGTLAHPQCHTSLATIYGTNTTIDVSGGWHDAADYGRYVKTGTKAVNDLLFAYMISPNIFTESNGSYQSNNGIADILDEVRYELDWLLKMQNSEDGGVFSKVLTTNVAEEVTPDLDNQPLYVISEETTSTADFCATLAVASKVYYFIDQDFAKKCLDASYRAYQYLKSTPFVEDQANPSDINGGEYRDDSDADGRFFSAIALWYATSDTSYLDDAYLLVSANPTCANGTTWQTNGGFGKYLFLSSSQAETTNSALYSILKESLTQEADSILGLVNGNGYNSSLESYVWGSNGITSDNGILLSMAYAVTDQQKYRQASIEQVNYLLGRNSLNLCFVSGFGSNSPIDVHSRVAKATGTQLVGALVGGPNASREDPVAQALDINLPPAKVYSDQYESYSTNELSIYWNSSLIHLLAQISIK